LGIYIFLPIRVAVQYKAWTVFACSNGAILGLNPIQGMNGYSVFVLSYVQVADLWRADHLSKESYRLHIKVYKTEGEARAQQKAAESLMDGWMDGWMNKYIPIPEFHINCNTLETNFFISTGKLLAYGIYTLLASLKCWLKYLFHNQKIWLNKFCKADDGI
jgi:hypothetical protein